MVKIEIMKKLQYLWEKINTSFWFIPILMLILASVSAVGLVYLDSQVAYSPEGVLRYLVPASADSASTILGIIAGAMIGVAGTVFSITLVVLTLASSQLGFSLVRNFMYDKLNQVVLGTYVSSFVYCLMVLSSIKENTAFIFVPSISVLVALISAFAGIILLVIFIHHVSISIQSDKVISDISKAMSKSIQKLFPDEKDHEDEKADPDLHVLKKTYAFKEHVASTKSGYLQSVDGQGLISIGKNNDCLIVLHQRPGDFLVQNTVLCEVFCHEACSKELHAKIQDDFIIGKVRTPFQDAEFSIHQMVEVASRALSPGVNDPYTAMACIDNLASIMCYLTGAKFPSPYRYDSDDKLRVVVIIHTFSGMLKAAFSQIRQYGEDSPAIIIRLMEAMNTISRFAKREEHQKLIVQHAKMLMNAAENGFSEKRDVKDVKDRYEILKKKINKTSND